MRSEVTLTLSDETGAMRRVLIETKRFTIGRSPDNDLTISDSNLSRRHAVIENFDGAILISDCGSRNGTTVNGNPVLSATALHDGDMITLGGSCDITVQMDDDGGAAHRSEAAIMSTTDELKARQSSAVQQTSHSTSVAQAIPSGQQPAINRIPHGGKRAVSAAAPTSVWLSTPVIAAVAALVILFVAGLFIIASKKSVAERNRTQRSSSAQKDIAGDDSRAQTKTDAGSASQTALDQEQSATTGDVTGNVSVEQVEKAAVQVMRRISSDDKPYGFTEKAVHDIKQKVEVYSGSQALRDALLTMQRGGGPVALQAQREGIEPFLVIYAGLAVTDGGRAGSDPVSAGREMIPNLLSLRATFGSGDANSSLIVIAAYKEGGIGSKKSHPLLATMRRLVRNPLTDRNVWFLHERGGLNAQSYDFVLRFLALGVISQNPRQFGIAADPLTF